MAYFVIDSESEQFLDIVKVVAWKEAKDAGAGAPHKPRRRQN